MHDQWMHTRPMHHHKNPTVVYAVLPYARRRGVRSRRSPEPSHLRTYMGSEEGWRKVSSIQSTQRLSLGSTLIFHVTNQSCPPSPFFSLNEPDVYSSLVASGSPFFSLREPDLSTRSCADCARCCSFFLTLPLRTGWGATGVRGESPP